MSCGSWFDKLTMRERVDATLVSSFAQLDSPDTSSTSVILGLDPRTYT
ncbi:hypothetical protein FHW17_001909 [Phyllobacterium sp. P30BS-XVII]|nr:hypothetical protein [Phyllobacterium sp. P30BS-XVII]